MTNGTLYTFSYLLCTWTHKPVHPVSILGCGRNAGLKAADSRYCGSDCGVAGTAATKTLTHLDKVQWTVQHTDCIKSNNAQIMSDKLDGFKITCKRIWLSSSLNPKTNTESRKSTSDICIHKHIHRRNSDTEASDTFSIVIHKFIYFWFLLFTKENHSLNVLFSLYTRVQLWLRFSLTSKRTISVPVLRWQVKKSAVKGNEKIIY